MLGLPIARYLRACDICILFQISQIEFIKALRNDRALAEKLNLPHTIQQEDESRRLFQLRFHEIDTDGSKTITLEEWLCYYCPPPSGDGTDPPANWGSDEGSTTQNVPRQEKPRQTSNIKEQPFFQRDILARDIQEGSLSSRMAAPISAREHSEQTQSPEKSSPMSKGTMRGKFEDEPWQTVALGRTLCEVTGKSFKNADEQAI